MAPITCSPTISGSASAECTPIRATRPPKCGQRPSLPSDPLTVGPPRLHARDAGPLVQFLVLNGVDVVERTPPWPPTSRSRRSLPGSINVTPAPSTPGMA